MNRRKFITSGVLGASLLTTFPSLALANQNASSLSSLGKGFEILNGNSNLFSVSELSNSIKKTHQELMGFLDAEGYVYNKNSITKLNTTSYILPITKKQLFGFESNQIAFIVKDGTNSNYYILNEKLSNEYNSLIVNFNENINQHNANVDLTEFSLPTKVIKQTKGLKNTFTFKNKFGDKITLHNYKKIAKTIIS